MVGFRKSLRYGLFVAFSLSGYFTPAVISANADSVKPARAPKEVVFPVGEQKIIEIVTKHDYNGIARGVMAKEFVILSPGVRYWAFLPPSTGYRGKGIENDINKNPVRFDDLNNR